MAKSFSSEKIQELSVLKVLTRLLNLNLRKEFSPKQTGPIKTFCYVVASPRVKVQRKHVLSVAPDLLQMSLNFYLTFPHFCDNLCSTCICANSGELCN